MKRFLLAACLALWPAAGSFGQTPVTIDLGPSKDVAALYSFPNNCAEVCFRDRTLAQTIEGYIRDSLKRDGFDATPTVVESAGRISVQLAGDGAADYATMLPKYLAVGKVGLQAARGLVTAEDSGGHKLWRYNW